MDKQSNRENPSLLPHNNTPKEESPRKPPVGGGGGGSGAGDRLKRDEWSEGAVSSLLEVYEAKWILRNRAKLKGQDWEDVAKYVSSRANSTKSPKSQTQCKNKIESMKKRYRSESAAADASSWPLFPRLDLLLRGSAHPPPPPSLPPPLPPPPPPPPPTNPPLVLLELVPSLLPQPPAAAPPSLPPLPLGVVTQNSNGSNGVDRAPKEDGVGMAKSSDHVWDKNPGIDTDSSTPAAAVYSDKMKAKTRSKRLKMRRMDKKKRRRKEDWEVAETIRWLAEAVVRSEQARMDTVREVERMRAEAEAKRGEMDLKRTEIIANTQLEIARLFAGIGKGIDSSLRIGRS